MSPEIVSLVPGVSWWNRESWKIWSFSFAFQHESDWNFNLQFYCWFCFFTKRLGNDSLRTFVFFIHIADRQFFRGYPFVWEKVCVPWKMAYCTSRYLSRLLWKGHSTSFLLDHRAFNFFNTSCGFWSVLFFLINYGSQSLIFRCPLSCTISLYFLGGWCDGLGLSSLANLSFI